MMTGATSVIVLQTVINKDASQGVSIVSLTGRLMTLLINLKLSVVSCGVQFE